MHRISSGRFFSIAVMAATEGMRQPTTLLLLLTSVLISVLTPLVFMHDFGEEGQMARDTALALHFFLGMFMTVSASAGVLAREMRSGTAATVLSKPVSRDMLLLAKYAGMAVLVMLFSFNAALSTLTAHRVAQRFFDRSDLFGYIKDTTSALLMVVFVLLAMAVAGFINYRSRRPFSSCAFMLVTAAVVLAALAGGLFDPAGQWAPYALRFDPAILTVSLLITMALLIISALALSLSTFCPPVAVMGLCSALFVLGLGSDYFFGGQQGLFAGVLYVIMPNWQHFWLADALNDGGRIPPAYLLAAAGYTLSYIAAILGAGVWIFRRVDVHLPMQAVA